MNLNSSLVQTIILAVGMFAIGGLLNGERINRRQERRQIKDIKIRQEIINAKVDSLHSSVMEQEKAILESIDSTYLILDEIYEQKAYSYQRYAENKQRIVRQREKFKATAKKMRMVSKSFTFKE
ncbi:MAG: hypothetical protein AAF806_31915 [Bacteroidota bacterium]